MRCWLVPSHSPDGWFRQSVFSGLGFLLLLGVFILSKLMNIKLIIGVSPDELKTAAFFLCKLTLMVNGAGWRHDVT